jgi:hypothetical protein
MKYKSDAIISEAIYKSDFFKDEIIYRQLCHRIIEEMSMEDIHKLFKCYKLDPFSNDAELKLIDSTTPDYEKKEIIFLRTLYQIKYFVNLNI